MKKTGAKTEKLWQTFSLPGGIYNFGSENCHNTYDMVRLLLENRGLSTACLKKNETAFAENPRNIRVNMEKARSYGIDFPGTLEQLINSFSISDT